jgi:hypothetical protein
MGLGIKKSTETACHTFIENIQQALYNKLHAVGIFLDFTKACDVINHNILLHKLESYGVRGIINSWFKSYLSECTQYVSLTQTNGKNNNILNRCSSLSRVNLHGVPQSLILGPLLFLIYINGLPRHFRGVNFVLYADDTNILVVDKDEEALQHKVTLVMRRLEIWLEKNDLIKCVQYHFTPTKIITSQDPALHLRIMKLHTVQN